MKKAMAAIIISICLLASLTDCHKKDDLTIRYEMEIKFNEADRLQSQLSLKGPVLSDDDLDSLVDAYLAVVKMISPPRDSIEVIKASNERKEAWALHMLANTRIGETLSGKKEYDKAFGYFKIVADNYAATPIQKSAVTNFMALCREKSGQFKEAAAWYDSLANGYLGIIAPSNPNLDALNAPIKAAEMWLKLGDRKKFKAKLAAARDYYNRLREKYPATPLEKAALGKIVASYLKQDKFQEAVSAIESVRNENTGRLSPRLLIMIADIHMNNTKDFKKAENACREFISSYPEHNDIGKVYLELGLSLYEQAKYSEARKAVKNIEKISQVSTLTVAEAFYLIALCYDKEGRWEKAIGQFDLVQATFPGSDKAFEAGLYVANRYKTKGQVKLAKRAFEEAKDYIIKYTDPVTANPIMISRALGYLVTCYTEMEDFPMAIETLTRLFKKYPLLPEGMFAPLRLADLYENVLKDNDKAAYWLETFLEANPEAPDSKNIQAHINELKQS